jgi:hypothetical protein
VSFFQDNACLHVAARTTDTIQKVKWNVLLHPPYTPDLALSDYHIFGPLKEHLGEKGFAIMRKWYRMFRGGYTGNQETSSLTASASFQIAGTIVSQTKEIMLKSNNFTFGELIKVFVLLTGYNSYLRIHRIRNNITKKNRHWNKLLI